MKEEKHEKESKVKKKLTRIIGTIQQKIQKTYLKNFQMGSL